MIAIAAHREDAAASIERRRLEALIEAVRRFQSETHRFGCGCHLCHELNRAVAAALPEGDSDR